MLWVERRQGGPEQRKFIFPLTFVTGLIDTLEKRHILSRKKKPREEVVVKEIKYSDIKATYPASLRRSKKA